MENDYEAPDYEEPQCVMQPVGPALGLVGAIQIAGANERLQNVAVVDELDRSRAAAGRRVVLWDEVS
jgi:hypothetical protein